MKIETYNNNDEFINALNEMAEQKIQGIKDFIDKMIKENMDIREITQPLLHTNVYLYEKDFQVNIFKTPNELKHKNQDLLVQVYHNDESIIIGVNRNDVDTKNWNGETIPTDDVDLALTFCTELLWGTGADDIFKDVSNNEGRTALFRILD